MRIFNKNKGFTLIELIVSMAIFSGIVLVITMFGLDIFDFGIFLGNDLVAQQEIQLTMKVIISEMRAMSQSANGSYPIESASGNSLVFYSDRDGDGFAERIRYFLEDNVLKKGVIVPEGVPLLYDPDEEDITSEVHNILTGEDIFSYYDSAYNGTQPAMSFPVNIPSVRMIGVNLTVDPNPIDSTARVNFKSSVNIRNL